MNSHRSREPTINCDWGNPNLCLNQNNHNRVFKPIGHHVSYPIACIGNPNATGLGLCNSLASERLIDAISYNPPLASLSVHYKDNYLLKNLLLFSRHIALETGQWLIIFPVPLYIVYKAWIMNYTNKCKWDMITHPCPKIHCDLGEIMRWMNLQFYIDVFICPEFNLCSSDFDQWNRPQSLRNMSRRPFELPVWASDGLHASWWIY